MGAAREVAMEVGGRAGSLGKKLPHGHSGGALVWIRDLGAFGTNDEEFIGSACGFPVTGHKKKAKRLRDGSWWQVTTKIVLKREGTQPLLTYVDRIQETVA